MLVLSRKHGDKILIGTDIVIEVVKIERGKVRIGITAPAGVLVDRKEVRDSRREAGSQDREAA